MFAVVTVLGEPPAAGGEGPHATTAILPRHQAANAELGNRGCASIWFTAGGLCLINSSSCAV